MAQLQLMKPGKERTNIAELKEHGACRFSDDGVGVQLACNDV